MKISCFESVPKCASSITQFSLSLSLVIICCSFTGCGSWARFVFIFCLLLLLLLSFYFILKMQTSILEMSRVSIYCAALCCSPSLPLISLINTPFVFVCSSTSFSSKFMDIVLLTDFYAEHCPPCVSFSLLLHGLCFSSFLWVFGFFCLHLLVEQRTQFCNGALSIILCMFLFSAYIFVTYHIQ